MNERIADDEDLAAYVAQLEDAEDTDWDDSPPTQGLHLAGVDELAAEVERFLRDHPSEG